MTAAAGAYALAGQAATLSRTIAGRTLTSDFGAYALTGRAAALRGTRRMPAAFGTYALTGYAAALTYGAIGRSDFYRYDVPSEPRVYAVPRELRSFVV